jgi:hypothetical protein
LVPAVLKERHVGEAVQFGEPRVDVRGNRFKQDTVSYVTNADAIARQSKLLRQPNGLTATMHEDSRDPGLHDPSDDDSYQKYTSSELREGGETVIAIVGGFRYGDQWIDATVMSVLAPEWPPGTATQG